MSKQFTRLFELKRKGGQGVCGLTRIKSIERAAQKCLDSLTQKGLHLGVRRRTPAMCPERRSKRGEPVGCIAEPAEFGLKAIVFHSPLPPPIRTTRAMRYGA